VSDRPPRIFRRLLERAVPPDGASGPTVAGDLHEEWAEARSRRGRIRADAWYAAQALAIALPYLSARLGRGVVDPVAGLIHGLGLDLRHTARSLARSPGTVLVAVLSLALGIGLTTAAASFVVATFFPRLPYPAVDRLMVLEDDHPVEVCSGCSPGTSWRSFHEWRSELTVFEAVEASAGLSAMLEIGGERSGTVRLAAVSGGYADLLGARTVAGRAIGPGDDRPGAPRVVVLGHGLWTERFGRAPGVVGRTVRLDGRPHAVVGILSGDTRTLGRSDAWVALEPALSAADRDYQARRLSVLARRSREVDAEEADQALADLAGARYAASLSLEAGWSARARPLEASLRDDVAPLSAGVAILTAPLLVLLIASLNLASLLLARVMDRRHELGVRAALGSGRARLLRVAMQESLALAAVGGLAGVGLARAGVEALARGTAGMAPGWAVYELDLRVLALAGGSTLLTAVVCAVLPLAWTWSRGAARLLGGPSATRAGPGWAWKQNLLLGGQIVLGTILVAGAATSARTFLRVADFDTLGYRWRGLATLPVALPEGAADSVDRADLALRVRRALATQPLVAAASGSAPLFLGSWGAPEADSPVRAAGAAAPVSNRVVPRHSLAVLPGWLELMEIPLRAGRTLDDTDGPGADPAAVVSEASARILWPDSDPTEVVGRRFLVSDGEAEHGFTVVGVAGDVVTNPRRESRRTSPRIYTSLAQTPVTLLDATPGSGLAMILDVGDAGPGAADWEPIVRSVEPDAAVGTAEEYAVALGRWLTSIRVTAVLMSVLGMLAIGLLALGIYGTLAYRVAAVRHEIGIRMALGAPSAAVVRTTTIGVAKVFGVALAVGATLAVPVAGAVRGGGVPVGSSDVFLLAAVAAALLVVGAAGCLVPVRRALRVDLRRLLHQD
jgi:putative ABC transport system permease protein